MTEKLKPCPFCGSDYVIDLRLVDKYVIKCSNCDAKIESNAPLITFHRWNARAKPPKVFEVGDTFYYVTKEGCIYGDTFSTIPSDLALLYMGNCFFTQEEAEEHKDEVMKKYEEISDK